MSTETPKQDVGPTKKVSKSKGRKTRSARQTTSAVGNSEPAERELSHFESFPALKFPGPEVAPERDPGLENYATKGSTEGTKTAGKEDVTERTSSDEKEDSGEPMQLSLTDVMTSSFLQLFRKTPSPGTSSQASCRAAQDTPVMVSGEASSFSDSGSSLRPDLCEHSQDKYCRCTLPRERDQKDGLCMVCDAGGCAQSDDSSEDGYVKVGKWATGKQGGE